MSCSTRFRSQDQILFMNYRENMLRSLIRPKIVRRLLEFQKRVTVKFSWLVDALRENFSLDAATGMPVAASSEKILAHRIMHLKILRTAEASNIFLRHADKCRKKFAERKSMRKNLLDAFQSKTREDAFVCLELSQGQRKKR